MKYSVLLFIVAIVCLSGKTALAAPCCILDLGIFNQPVNSLRLEIRVKPTLQVIDGNYSAGTFVVRYPSSYGNTLSVFSSPYGYTIGAQGTDAGYKYYAFFFGGSNTGINWFNGQEVVVATLSISNTGSGYGTFELTTDAFAASLTGGDPLYQELSNNGENGGGSGQQGIFYQTSTLAPLPVELAEFSATLLPDRTVDLDWIAATERDMAYYGVEYSADGHKFNQLDQVTAAGTTSVATTYTYIHPNPQAGTNYYRLRMVNRDGTFEYSPIRSVVLEGMRHHFSLVPTPTTGPLALISANLEQYADGLRYQLTDNSGKILLFDGIYNEKTDFNLSTYAAGFYYLTIFTDQEQLKQFKVIVTKD